MKKLRILGIVLLVCVLGCLFVACIPSNPAKAVTNLQKESYTVYAATEGETFKEQSDSYSGLSEYVYAVKDSEYVKIWYFSSVKDAKNSLDKIKNDFVGYSDNDDVKCARSGKYVYVGTKKGVKAAK